ncbi:MAG: hypothetical protein OXN17_17335 [Candidatus Poribacteria bacterium]|nr:hypothetical protein [Candidatus Poribacteria bacterium]
MDEWIRIVLPMAGTFVAIAALWWKLTSSVATKNDISSLKSDLKDDIADLKADMNRADDSLQKQINHAVDLTLSVTQEIREDMRQMRSEFLKLGEKMDAGFTRLDNKIDSGLTRLDDKMEANSQASHAETMKLSEKIDNVANDLRAEIRERKNDKTDSVDS